MNSKYSFANLTEFVELRNPLNDYELICKAKQFLSENKKNKAKDCLKQIGLVSIVGSF